MDNGLLRRIAKKLPELSDGELESIELHIDGIRMRKRELAMPLPMSSFKSSPSHWPEPHPSIPHTPSRVASAEASGAHNADAAALYDSFAEFTLGPPSAPLFKAVLNCGHDGATYQTNTTSNGWYRCDCGADDPSDVHAPECEAESTDGAWCNCSASEGHGRECARWEGFDRCDCSLSDDPYKERKTTPPLPRSVFLCDYCNTVSAPHSSCRCKRNQEADLFDLPAVGRRLAVRIKTGAYDHVTGAEFLAVESDGRWRVQLEKRGVALVDPSDILVGPESWRVE